MKIFGAFILSLVLIINAFAQKVEMPQFLPASPEPSAFVKAGVGNVNMSTGAATASIPLYTIKLKNYSFPISLSYSTQGLRADEASSRTGYGWVLNASSGMITRSVKGEPDEFAQRMVPPTDFTTDTDALFQYYQRASAAGSGYDTQSDEFQFNCNGYSGKFVLDNNYKPRVTATSNIKIDAPVSVTPGSTSGSIGPITLTAPDGVRYFFSTYERTTSHNIMKYSAYKLVTKTAFFLDKILLPSGEYILFNYTPINTTVATGTSQTLQVSTTIGVGDCGNCEGSYSTQSDQVSYATYYLSSITTSNGQTVNFTYEDRPDKGNDNRLVSMEVAGLKKYEFQYYDVPMQGSVITGRFFLTKIRDIIMDGSNASYDYILDYNDLSKVPLPITFSQDYLGYYNNSGSNCLIPPAVNSNNTIDFSFRDPHSDASQIGTLASIVYPTGGKEEYLYEANTQSEKIEKSSTKKHELAGAGGGTGGTEEPITYTQDNITVSWDQTVTLSAYADDALPFDEKTADPGHRTVVVSVYEGNNVVGSRSVLGYAPTSTTFSLQAGHVYTLKMTVYSSEEIGYATLVYDVSTYYIYQNKEIPGVRLKQLRYTDPFTGKNYSKYYTYAALGNLSKSSGSLSQTVDYHSFSLTKKFCGEVGEFSSTCNFDVYSSSSTNDVYNYAGSGSPVYYSNVIESDAPDFQNGGTEYIFYENDNGSNWQLMLGQNVDYFSGQYPSLSGTLFKKRVFNKKKEIVQEEQDDYESLVYMDHSTYSIYVRKKYEPWDTRPDRLDSFDAIRATYSNNWNRLKTKTSTSYVSGKALLQKTDYIYGDPVNVLPAIITTSDSKGKQIRTVRKYPNTYTYEGVGDDGDPALSGYNALTVLNIVAPVVEEFSYKNDQLISQKKTLYKDWFSDLRIIEPQIVQIKESPNDVLRDALVFDKYNQSGNATQLHMKDNLTFAYLWDDILDEPICEVKNAVFDQVAYTSFENNAYGNWTVVSGGISSTPGFTGTQSFSGSIQKNIAISGSYTVSLWTKQSATVNSSAGTLIRTLNDWKLYRWTLNNPSVVTVQGNDLDEVRLAPANALMTTFTYKPYVGLTSKLDSNNSTMYYEYDSFNRLSVIRDEKGNIVKTVEYHYQEQ